MFDFKKYTFIKQARLTCLHDEFVNTNNNYVIDTTLALINNDDAKAIKKALDKSNVNYCYSIILPLVSLCLSNKQLKRWINRLYVYQANREIKYVDFNDFMNIVKNIRD